MSSANCKALPSPIDALPAEVLLKIFHAFIAECDPTTTARVISDVGRPLQLTRVSRRWRMTAIDDSSLWTNVLIDGTSQSYSLYFKWSAPLPIDISIQFSFVNHMALKLARMVTIALKHELDLSLKAHPYPAANRIRTVRILTNDTPSATVFTTALDGYRLPSLTTFVASSEAPDADEEDLDSDGFSDEPYPEYRPPIRQLPTLTFMALYGVSRRLTVQDLRKIFSSCPQLQTFIVGVMELDGEPIPFRNRNPTTILVPQLRTLVVASPISRIFSSLYYEDCIEGCFCVFRDLIAPKLQYVEVAGKEIRDPLYHIIPLINRSAGIDREGKPALQVMINASHPACMDDGLGRYILPISQDIHFHYFPHTNTDQDFQVAPDRDIEAWLLGTRSTTFYIPIHVHDLHPINPPPLRSLPHIQPKYASWHHGQPSVSRGMIPVLLHPTDPTLMELTEGGIGLGPRYDPRPTKTNPPDVAEDCDSEEGSEDFSDLFDSLDFD